MKCLCKDVILTTCSGRLRGILDTSVYDDTFYSFQRIPFAKPALGDLRFKPPLPIEPWKGILECTVMGQKAAQKSFRTGEIEGSEDCLYLNMYVKKFQSKKPLPVMVFLHGGGFERGTALRDHNSPDYFMMKDVVVAVVAYRVGPLGFLSLPDPSVNVPGNGGLYDIILALRWIKQNALCFNGDPDNITLFGESCGSAAVHYLLCSPAAEGLFHKAIMMSGTMLCPWAFSPLTDIHKRLAKATGLDESASDQEILEHLQSLPVEDILRPQLLTMNEKLDDVTGTCIPIVEPYTNDRTIISKGPEEFVTSAWGNNIPLIIGGSSFEGLLAYERMKMNPAFLDLLNQACQHLLPAAVKKKLPPEKQMELGKQLKELYFGDKPIGFENILRFCDFASYKHFWHPIVRSIRARLHSSHNCAATYLYRFEFDSPDFNHERVKNCGTDVRGVAHVDDRSYLWYGTFSWKLSRDSAEFKTIQRMIGMYTSFAASGNPNCPEIAPVQWQPLVAERNLRFRCLNISHTLEMIDLPEMEKLKSWDQLYAEN